MISIRLPSPLNCVVISVVGACLAVSLTDCGGGGGKSSSSPPGPTNPIPGATTTLQAETSNNTSTADSFARQTNGNDGTGNLSKLPLQSLRPGVSNTKRYVPRLALLGR